MVGKCFWVFPGCTYFLQTFWYDTLWSHTTRCTKMHIKIPSTTIIRLDPRHVQHKLRKKITHSIQKSYHIEIKTLSEVLFFLLKTTLYQYHFYRITLQWASMQFCVLEDCIMNLHFLLRKLNYIVRATFLRNLFRTARFLIFSFLLFPS